MNKPTITLHCGDCLEYMKSMPDKSIDLVLTDPPYGLTWSATTLFGKITPQTMALQSLQQWDKRPEAAMFSEIKRISTNQIIWGGNYFATDLGDWKSPFVWDKQTGDNNYADGEMAWTSLAGTLRIWRHQWCGAFKDSERGEQNIHPTQKPIELMKWCILQAEKKDETITIFDPFMGSGTTGVACKLLRRNFVGCEISKQYFDLAKRRIDSTEWGMFE
jgi:site-specific DNA-methyltransferase (adenine-specific)